MSCLVIIWILKIIKFISFSIFYYGFQIFFNKIVEFFAKLQIQKQDFVTTFVFLSFQNLVWLLKKLRKKIIKQEI